MSVSAVRRVGVQSPLAGVADSILSPYAMAPLPSGGDDYAVIQALINNASLGIGPPVILLHVGNYLFSVEPQIPANPGLTKPGVRLIGVPSAFTTGTPSGTVFTATTPGMRSCLAVLSRNNIVAGIWANANHKATSGYYLLNAFKSQFNQVVAADATVDGFNVGENSGEIIYDGVIGLRNGTLYATAGIIGDYTNLAAANKTQITGTATTTNGSPTIVIAGGPDLTTFGIRKGDFVRVGATVLSAYYGKIDHVTATTIVLQNYTSALPTISAGALPFALEVGDGLHYDIANSNSNISQLNTAYFVSNAGVGLSLQNYGYPDAVINLQSDLNGFFGFSVGAIDGGTTGGGLFRVYTENNTAGAGFVGSADGFEIHAVTFGDTAAGGVAKVITVPGLPAPVITWKGYSENLAHGAPQNFLFTITNAAGTLRHRVTDTVFAVGNPANADRVIGWLYALSNTPNVAGGATAFTAGAGIDNGLPGVALNTAAQSGPALSAKVEYDDTGTGPYVVVPHLYPSNVNGVTLTRLAFLLFKPSTGAYVAIDTTTIPAGKSIAIRFDGSIQ